MKTLSAVILTLLLGCGSSGSSQEAFAGDFVPVNLYVIRHPEALTLEQVQQAWDYAQARFDAVGIPVRLAKIVDVTDWESRHFDDPLAQGYRLEAVNSFMAFKGWCTPWEIHYWLFPPMHWNGELLFGGLAQGICAFKFGGVALGQSGAWSSHEPPRPRIEASGMIIAHEIGHLLGAWHRDAPTLGPYPENIMDSAAGRFIDAVPLWFLKISEDEIRECLGMTRTRSVKLCRQRYKNRPLKRRRCIKQVKKNAPVVRSDGAVDGGFYFE